MNKILMLIIIISMVLMGCTEKPEQIKEQEKWKCDKIVCGNTSFEEVEFTGSMFYWTVRGCSTENCYRVIINHTGDDKE